MEASGEAVTSCEALGACPPPAVPQLIDPFLFRQLAASSLGGLITAVVVNPFDVIKTRLQAQVRAHNDFARLTTFNSSLDAVRKITRSEGAMSLFTGLRVSMALSIPSTAIYFTTYDTPAR
jgi:hypothetical protein